MKSNNYEYKFIGDDYEITEKRKGKMIEKIKNQVNKDSIAHCRILRIGKNDEELDFLYNWLDNNNIEINGINGTIAGEIPNYMHLTKIEKSSIPQILDEEEQEKLFLELNKFSKKDKEEGAPEYLAVRTKIIEHSMKLAKWITSWNGIAQIPIPLDDKEQMAYMGLIEAVDKYDPEKGNKFSPYAIKVISRRIFNQASKDEWDTKQYSLAKKQIEMIPYIEEEIFTSFGREAKPQEIASKLGISLKRLNELQTLRKLKAKESLEQFDEVRRDEEKIIGDFSDSDRVIKTTDEAYVKDGVYIDEKDDLPEGFREKDRVKDKIMSRMLSQDLKNSLLKLNEKERKIILLRFGFEDGKINTYTEICEKLGLGVSRERVRQIEAKALNKLKIKTSRRLEAYLEEDDYGIDEIS